MMRYQPLSEFLTEYTLRNDNNQYKPVAVGRYGIRTRDSIYSKELAKDYSKNKVIYKNTLTVGMGSVQIDIGILTEDIKYSVSPAYHTYEIHDINPTYLRYCLECRNQDMFTRFVKRGSRQGKSIDLNRWLTYAIPVIDEQEQAKIVSVLDRVSMQISNRHEQLELFEQLVKSRFIELFGDPFINPMKWKKIKIEEAVTIEPQNGMYKPQSDYVTDGSGTPILRIDGFYDGVVTDFSSLKRLLCEDKEKQKYLLKEDDIVINRVNSIEYLGKCAHITGMLEETVYESNMMRMHFDSERFNPVYITRLLCSRFLYDQIVGHAKKAVNQASINQKDVLDFDIYQPPIELQNQFATFVEQTDKSKYFACQTLSFLLKLANNLQSWREKQYDY